MIQPQKTKLCGLPFEGDLVFDPDLEAVLDRTADEKKAFPVKKKVIPQGKKNFRPFRKTQDTKETGYKNPGGPKEGRASQGYYFAPLPKAQKTSDSLPTVGARLQAFFPQWKTITNSPFYS